MHEFGHIMGLSHYPLSDERKALIYQGLEESPSLMVEEILGDLEITKTDIKDVLAIYDGVTGFGDLKQLPDWIKNNAGWWNKGLLSDKDFIKGMEYLIENGIIVI